MKWELDDSTLLKVSGVAAVAFGASALAVPRDWHNRFYASVRLGLAQGGRSLPAARRRSCACRSPPPVRPPHPPPAFTLPPQSAVFSEAPTRYSGVVGSWLGAEQLVIAARDDLGSRVRGPCGA